MEALRLSEYEAFARIEAARAGRRFPRVFELLLDGSLCLTTVQLLARRLTPENHQALLAEAVGKSKRDVEHLLARWFPQPDVPDRMRKLPAPRLPAATQAADAALPTAPSATALASPAPSPIPPPTAATWASSASASVRAAITPLAPDRYKVTFTADTETTELLELAKDMLSHAVPNGETAEVVKRALKNLVDDLARKRFARTHRPRTSKGPRDRSDIPAKVKREVWVRDRGRCAFVGTNGRRCGSRWHLQFHHLHERSQGGKGTAENIQLRCAAHNRYESQFENGVPKRAPGEYWPGTRSGPSRASPFA
jgi:5-methylcytosine-specific restriction endonuclease McrA